MPIELPPPLWTAPKPGIIRAWGKEDIASAERHARAREALIGGGLVRKKRSGLGPATTITFLNSVTSTADTASRSFTVDLTAGVYAHYLIGMGARATGTTPTLALSGNVTLAGSNCATLMDEDFLSGSANWAAFAIIANPGVSGSQNISYTLDAVAIRAMVCAWGINNLNSMTPTDTLVVTDIDPTTGAIDVAAGGVIGCVGTDSGNPNAATPVGVDERADVLVEISRWFAGDHASVAGESARSVGADWSGGEGPVVVAVALR